MQLMKLPRYNPPKVALDQIDAEFRSYSFGKSIAKNFMETIKNSQKKSIENTKREEAVHYSARKTIHNSKKIYKFQTHRNHKANFGLENDLTLLRRIKNAIESEISSVNDSEFGSEFGHSVGIKEPGSFSGADVLDEALTVESSGSKSSIETNNSFKVDDIYFCNSF